MDTKKGRQHSGFAALLLDSIYYLVVSYGLECFLLSWRTNPLFIVVFASKINCPIGGPVLQSLP